LLMAVILPLTLYGIITDRNILISNLESNGVYLVKNLAQNSETGVFSENELFLKTPLFAILEADDTAWAAVYGVDGKLISSNFADRIKMPLVSPEELSFIKGKSVAVFRKNLLNTGGRAFLDFYAPIFLKNEFAIGSDFELGTDLKNTDEIIGIARVGMTLEGISRRTDEIIKTALLLTSLCFLLGFAAILYIQKKVSMPIKELSIGAKAIGQGNLDALFGGFIGILVGSGIFAHLYPHLQSVLKKGWFGEITIPEYFKVNPWLVVLPLCLIIILFFYWIESIGL